MSIRYAIIRFFSKSSIEQAIAEGYKVNHGDLFQYASIRDLLNSNTLSAVKFLALAHVAPNTLLTMWSSTRYIIEDALSQDVNRIAAHMTEYRPTEIGRVRCAPALHDPVQVTELCEFLYDQLQDTIASFESAGTFMAVPIVIWSLVAKAHFREAITDIVTSAPSTHTVSPYILAASLIETACSLKARSMHMAAGHGIV